MRTVTSRQLDWTETGVPPGLTEAALEQGIVLAPDQWLFHDPQTRAAGHLSRRGDGAWAWCVYWPIVNLEELRAALLQVNAALAAANDGTRH